MTDNVRRLALEEETARRLIERLDGRPLQHGGGGGTSDGMDSRITKLETHFEYVRKDLDQISADQKTIIARLGELPTKRDLTANILIIVTIGIATLAIVVTGIVGGLAWIDRSEPAAISVQQSPTELVPEPAAKK